MVMISRPSKWKIGDTQTSKISNKEQKTGSGNKEVAGSKKKKLIFSNPALLK